jgi:hypothetical protein
LLDHLLKARAKPFGVHEEFGDEAPHGGLDLVGPDVPNLRAIFKVLVVGGTPVIVIAVLLGAGYNAVVPHPATAPATIEDAAREFHGLKPRQLQLDVFLGQHGPEPDPAMFYF